MRFQITILFFLFSIKSFGQSAPIADTNVKFQKIELLSKFIDSIKAQILLDTTKFDKNDVIATSKGKVNAHSYSPLFFINVLYRYKLDIVSSSNVVAFVNEILSVDKIESITLLDEPKSMKIFGAHGKNGTIIINMKDISKINLYVAGFKSIRTAGDNFH